MPGTEALEVIGYRFAFERNTRRSQNIQENLHQAQLHQQLSMLDPYLAWKIFAPLPVSEKFEF